MDPCFDSYLSVKGLNPGVISKVIYLINLTGQKQYVIALEWISPVIVSGDSPQTISSLVLLYYF